MRKNDNIIVFNKPDKELLELNLTLQERIKLLENELGNYKKQIHFLAVYIDELKKTIEGYEALMREKAVARPEKREYKREAEEFAARQMILEFDGDSKAAVS